mmetsp:Transcript_28617/g.46374  ORF Transcript_28617/g.46374 Transcript_28617/m.46374 type:complete len:316 (+) Transcript_28617:118-1065(+)
MLTAVEISTPCFLACLTHALSTEREEVMGLCLGQAERSSQGEFIAKVWCTSIQERADRRKDRVEVSPEQLAEATAEAERISEQTKINHRIIGWYHSHPHITVLPSHVDVRTQGQYQMLDECFIGLIFSCFHSEAATQTGRIQLTAFQSISIDDRPKHPTRRGEGGVPIIDLEDSSSHESSSHPQESEIHENSTAEFENASRLLGSTRYEQREVPIQIVDPPLPNPTLKLSIDQMIHLQKIFFDEEMSQYRSTLQGSKSGALLNTYCSAVVTKSLVKLLEHGVFPLARALEDRLRQSREKLNKLKLKQQEEKTQRR